MRYYETMYIVNPSFEEQRLNKIIETLNQEFEKNKVKVINHYLWGKKKLLMANHQYHLAYNLGLIVLITLARTSNTTRVWPNVGRQFT